MTEQDIDRALREWQRGDASLTRRLLLREAWQELTDESLIDQLVELALIAGEENTALHLLQMPIDRTPTNGKAWMRKGQVLRRRNRPEEALPYLEKAYSLEPNNPDTAYEWAMALEDTQRYTKALQVAQSALTQHPNDIDLLNLTAGNYANLGKPELAIPLYVQALHREPEHHALAFNLAQALLQHGNWQEGWRFFDYRLLLRPPDRRPRTTARLWQGDPLAGKSILIWQEQGFGDTIQFMRFLPLLWQQGAQVVLLVHPQLIRLSTYNFPCLTVVDQRTDPPPTDYQLPILSLARRLGLEQPDQLTGEPYLRAPSQPQLPATAKKRIGLVWAGNPNHPDDHRRSIPPDELAPLLTFPQYHFYSFQVGRQEWASSQDAVTDLQPQLTDFLATAGLLRQMDLVVTVDTAVAHLAGALGRPVWLLLDQAADWRWGAKGQGPNWYASMRLFRQQKPGDWTTLVQTVVNQWAV